MSWGHGGCLELCFAACQVHKVSVCNNVALNIINIILKILTAIVYLLTINYQCQIYKFVKIQERTNFFSFIFVTTELCRRFMETWSCIFFWFNWGMHHLVYSRTVIFHFICSVTIHTEYCVMLVNIAHSQVKYSHHTNNLILGNFAWF